MVTLPLNKSSVDFEYFPTDRYSLKDATDHLKYKDEVGALCVRGLLWPPSQPCYPK